MTALLHHGMVAEHPLAFWGLLAAALIVALLLFAYLLRGRGTS